MPKFSKTSQDKLATCDPKLQMLFNEVIKKLDCTIVCGERGKEEQDEAYRQGKSDKMYPASKHNMHPSKAVDVVPYPVDWKDTERFCFFAGYVKSLADQLGINIRWGNDWDSDMDFKEHKLHDYPHFELV